MKIRAIVKIMVVTIVTIMLSVGSMFAQRGISQGTLRMQIKISDAQMKAANALSRAEAEIEKNPSLAAIYPPGFFDRMEGIANGTIFPSTLVSAQSLIPETPAVQIPTVQNYGLIDIGALVSGNQSYAYGINNDGTIVGSLFIEDLYTWHAFKYMNNQMHDISSVTAGIIFQVANSINNVGEIVGSGVVPSNNDLGHALRYFNGTVQDLTPGLGYHCSATSINNHGQIAGYCNPQVFPAFSYGHNPVGSYSPNAPNQLFNQSDDAFMITGGLMTDLGTLDGFNSSSAYGLNDDGQVVGSAWGNSQHAFSYSNDGFMIDLDGDLGANDNSVAYGINNSGQITGQKYNSSFIYSITSGQMTDLGALDDSNNYSTGMGINNSGVVVGTVYINSIGENHAFVYSGGSMRDLNDLIDLTSGLKLQYATAINDVGQITGYGVNSSGQTHAFLLNPYSIPTYTGFYQNDGGVSGSGVPATFGYDNISTSKYGCALCSLATMLTSLPTSGSITPAQLNAELTSLPNETINQMGYNNGSSIYWPIIGQLTGYPVSYSQADSKQVSDPVVLDKYLNDHCWGNRYRVILQFKVTNIDMITGIEKISDHFVFVVGKTNNNDWVLFDPGWKHAYVDGQERNNVLGSLNGHYAGFTTYSTTTGHLLSWQFAIEGVRTFVVNPSSTAYTSYVAHSPVEVTVTDPNGSTVGYDPISGADVFEIPGASYVRDFSLIDVEGDSVPVGDANGVKTVCIPSPLGGTYSTILTGTASGSYTFDSSVYWSGNNGITKTISGTTDVGVMNTNVLFVVKPPVIMANTSTGGMFNLVFTSQENVTYVIEGVNSLTDTNWTSLQELMATGSVMTASQPITSSTMFFRVRSQ